MSGHSKWSTIKRKKGAADAKRGAIFSKLTREITVAAKLGGNDVNVNPRLKAAITKAKENNMPTGNIEKAIKRGTGNLDGMIYEEIRYEGYGPGGIAIMIDCLTENRNRTMPEIRSIFSKCGGNLGETGCVSYLFDRKGIIVIEGEAKNEEKIIELVIDHGIEDIRTEDDNVVIIIPVENYNNVNNIINEKGFSVILSEITFIPKTLTKLDEFNAEQSLKLIDALEDCQDVQHVYSNYDIADDIMNKISEDL